MQTVMVSLFFPLCQTSFIAMWINLNPTMWGTDGEDVESLNLSSEERK